MSWTTTHAHSVTDLTPLTHSPLDRSLKALGLPLCFVSTKGKHVPGNYVGAVRVKTHREYRQYMNRRGGFNRPLDPEPGHKQRK